MYNLHVLELKPLLNLCAVLSHHVKMPLDVWGKGGL